MTSVCVIDPPRRAYRAPRHWSTFERLFQPEPKLDGSLLWDYAEIPRDANARHWWTVVECDGKLFVSAGFHVVNRLAYLKCANAWGGDWSAHPEYCY